MRPERPHVDLYVDRDRPGCWIARDPAGRFWLVPAGDRGWDRRQPYTPEEDARLESVPGHYGYLLGIAG